MTKQFICIRCPKGCIIDATYEKDNIISITGNTCTRGKDYVTEEITCPKRMVTSTVKIEDGLYNVVSVATDKAINKELIFDLMNLLKDVTVKAPVNIGDIIIKNVLNTDVNIVVTRSMKKM